MVSWCRFVGDGLLAGVELYSEIRSQRYSNAIRGLQEYGQPEIVCVYKEGLNEGTRRGASA